MNLSNAESIFINGKEIRSIEIDGKIVYEKVNMSLLASKEFIVSDETVDICLESDLKEKEVELFKVIGMTRTSLGSKTTGSDGKASWSYTGTGAGTVGFVAVYDDKDSNTVTVDDYTPVASSIGLVADKSAIISGQSVLLTATVKDQHSQSISSGTVTFKVNGTSVGTGSISGGVATLTTSSFSDGVNQVTAEVGSVSSDIVNVSVVGAALTLGITGSSFSSGISNPFVYTGSVLIDWGDGSTLETYAGGTLSHTYASSGNYEIEIYGNITETNTGAFESQKMIVSATIDSSITTLGRGTFMDCTALTNVNVSTSVESIGNDCFTMCRALTEIVLNWDSASSIVTYDSDWLSGAISFDHFLIPQGTTSLYTAKNYPSALLQEQGGVEPDSIDLTGTKSILSFADTESSVLTATVLDENNAPIEGVSVSIYKDNTLWYTADTNSSGEISKTYASAGSGDISFEARVAKGSTFLTKTYSIRDDLFYDSMINSVKNNWQIDSGTTVSSDSTGTTFNWNNATRYIKLPVSETSFVMEWDYITGSGITPMGVQTWNGTTWVSYATHKEGKYLIEGTSTQNYTSSVQTNVHCKYVVNGNSHSFYVGEQLIGTVTKKTASGDFYIGFYVSSACTSQKIKNVEIKPL